MAYIWVTISYWNLFSFNPALKAEDKNTFPLSGKHGDGSYQAFLANESRFSSFARKFPDHTADLLVKSEGSAQALFDYLQKMAEFYK